MADACTPDRSAMAWMVVAANPCSVSSWRVARRTRSSMLASRGRPTGRAPSAGIATSSSPTLASYRRVYPEISPEGQGGVTVADGPANGKNEGDGLVDRMFPEIADPGIARDDRAVCNVQSGVDTGGTGEWGNQRWYEGGGRVGERAFRDIVIYPPTRG